MRYPDGMLPLLEPPSGGWLLLVGPSSRLNSGLLQAIAQFQAPQTQAGPRVLDGGNRFNA